MALIITIGEVTMIPLNINELSLGSKAGICWGFFWRGIAITIASSICGGLIGGVVGFIFGLIGLPKGIVMVVSAGLGIAVGLCSIYFYVRWLLGSRLGGYRLALVEA